MKASEITTVFEISDLLADIIVAGLSKLANDGRLSAPEVYSYIFDNKHELDAKLIAEAVREFNQKGEK